MDKCSRTRFKKILSFISLTSGLLLVMPAVFALSAEGDKKLEAQNLVKKAIVYTKNYGKDMAIKEMNTKNGLFSKNESYIFALDKHGVLLASSNTPEYVGKNRSNEQDPDGKFYNQEMMDKVEHGGGWVVYRYKNPETGKTECKNSYVQSVTADMWVGAGYYFPENATTHKCEEQ